MKHPRWWFYLPAVLVVVVGSIVFGSRVAEMTSQNDSVAVAAAPPSFPAAAPRDTPQPYDYFPDHYANQAKEASQPVDQF